MTGHIPQHTNTLELKWVAQEIVVETWWQFSCFNTLTRISATSDGRLRKRRLRKRKDTDLEFWKLTVITSCSWNCTVDWAGIFSSCLTVLNQSKQTKRFLIYMVIGPSAPQVITQNKTALQALRRPAPHARNAHTENSPTARLPYVSGPCCFLLFFFSCWLGSFSVLPKAVLFFRLSLTRQSCKRSTSL